MLIKTTLSKEDQIIEFIRCKNDPVYFISNYIVLELPGKSEIMKMDDLQVDLVKRIYNDKFLVILKSRQTGISTVVEAYCTYLCTFFKNVTVGITSKDAKEASDFGSIISTMIKNLPKWMRSKFLVDNVQSFRMSNGCKLYASTVDPKKPDNTLRGKPISFLVNDEAAHTRNIEEAYTSMASTIATAQDNAIKNNIPYGTIVLSTPNKTTGIGKWFYKKWKQSNSGKSMFKPIKIHWKDIPRLKNSDTWYKKQCELLDNNKDKLDQELELKFVPSEGGFFESNICIKLQEDKPEPIHTEEILGGLSYQYEKPVPGKYYLIGVDTASERGSDFSTIEILDYEDLSQVWEYRGKLKVKMFSGIVNMAASLYSNCLIIVEITGGYGNQVVEELEVSHNVHKLYIPKDEKLPGLKTTLKTRPLLIDSLCYVNEFPNTIKSNRLALELVGLQEKKGKVQGDDNDDLVLALSFCYYVRKYDPPIFVPINKKLQNRHKGLEINPEFGSIEALKKTLDFNSENDKNMIPKNSDIKDMVLNNNKHGEYVNVLSLFNNRG